MVTLAFAQMAYFVFHDTKVGGGSDGIYLYFVPPLAIGSMTLLDLERRSSSTTSCSLRWCWRFCCSRCCATRASAARSRASASTSSGCARRLRDLSVQARAFVIAAMLAGLAGFLFALKDGYVNPELCPGTSRARCC